MKLTDSATAFVVSVLLGTIVCVPSFPIVFVYTISEETCRKGVPNYLKFTLEQGLLLQEDCEIVMMGNYAECTNFGKEIDLISGVVKIETTDIASNRSDSFANSSSTLFAGNHNGHLWISSAQRFFSLENLMVKKGYTEMLHVEADNLLFGRITDVLPALRSGYPSLTATPLTPIPTFVTASVLWIPNLSALQKFNSFLLALGTNDGGVWNAYLKWLRPLACCIRGGIDPDKDHMGIKPFAINEMSMMAFYHFRHPKDFAFFPVVPSYNYVHWKRHTNIDDFSPNGKRVGPPTGQGIWDPGSWGQQLGGTFMRHGRDVGFADSNHIVGQAIQSNVCKTVMLCSNVSRSNPTNLTTPASASCYTAPYVRCLNGTSWTPLWNLHVHSKLTAWYNSKICPCPV